jgi:hypothetical protein
LVGPRARRAKARWNRRSPTCFLRAELETQPTRMEGAAMTDLVTNLMMAETAVVTLAGVVSARVMKAEIPFSIQVLEDEYRSDYLAPARGVVAGTTLAAVLWTAVFGLCAFWYSAGAGYLAAAYCQAGYRKPFP